MIYLDNHATTLVDPRVIAAMLPLLSEHYANPGSITHEMGRSVAGLVEDAIAVSARAIGANADELVVTSGATESNNLALIGYATHPRNRRRKIISCTSEHRAVLDPLLRLEQLGYEVVRLPVLNHTSAAAGCIDLDQLADRIDENTSLVSIMLVNNEIGVIQPIGEIAHWCRRFGAVLHTDATQAVGRIAIDVNELDVDLLSFSAHKFYGPKGVGGLYVRSSPRRIRLQPQILGGGQQDNLRSGTLNSIGIVAMARALELCDELASVEVARIASLRDRLYRHLVDALPGLSLNGPALEDRDLRVAGNLNCCFYPIEGQSLMLETPELAVSSGSACTSRQPGPSHVLEAIGLSVEQARSSLRFGLGRFTTEQEIDLAAQWLIDAHQKLRRML